MNFASRVIIQAFRNVLSSRKREIDCRHALNITLSMLDSLLYWKRARFWIKRRKE